MMMGEEEKVMEEKTKFSWEEKIHHMGPLHPDTFKLRDLKHWLHLAWWQNLF